MPLSGGSVILAIFLMPYGQSPNDNRRDNCRLWVINEGPVNLNGVLTEVVGEIP